MLSLQDIDAIVLNGGIVIDPAGDKIGSVEQIFTTGDSGDPAFVTVRTGLFGMSESFIPLDGAVLDGTVITAAVSKDMVKDGPRLDSDRGTITESQEQELYRYFGLEPGQTGSGNTSDTGGGPETGSAGNSQAASQATADSGVPAAARRPPQGRPPLPPHLLRHVPAPPPPRPGRQLPPAPAPEPAPGPGPATGRQRPPAPGPGLPHPRGQGPDQPGPRPAQPSPLRGGHPPGPLHPPNSSRH